ncbi:MAG: choice-of-anchor D domain-containing protein, partial [Candidatus Binataceae bacterium]
YNVLTAQSTCVVGEQLAPGQKCTVVLTFTPSAAAKSTGTLAVTNNGTRLLTAKLSGTGVLGALTAAPKSLAFGKVTVGSSASKTVTISNKNSVAISINPIAFTGSFPGDYSETDTCGSSIAAAGSCVVTVQFTPAATGSRPATMVISGTIKAQLNIKLTGSGT